MDGCVFGFDVVLLEVGVFFLLVIGFFGVVLVGRVGSMNFIRVVWN